MKACQQWITSDEDLDEEVDAGRDLDVLAELQIAEELDALHGGLAAVKGGVHVRDGVAGNHVGANHLVEAVELAAELFEAEEGRCRAVYSRLR